MFHSEKDVEHLPVLQDLKQKGWLRHFGVSCDNEPEVAASLAGTDRLAAMQLPGNMLDARHFTSGTLSASKQSNIAVFIRSVYLQGLLLMPEERVPSALAAALPARHRLQSLAGESGLSMAEMALRYVLSIDGVTSVLTGVENETQIRHNISIADRGPLPCDLMQAIQAAVPVLSEKVLSPKLWNTD